ncbi:MAG: carboxyl transferase domain-containing protein [Peptoniphilaceae bacterium]|nr:carboxyl transferase domain-containing protein [Peptoniphilaceae bacterium]MDY6085345.1 carboxyl transferase domain-containing protein [Peptoniphilaceae bacterium]
MSVNMYSMPGYFQTMPTVGSPLNKVNAENAQELKDVEANIAKLMNEAAAAGKSDEGIHKSGQMTVLERIFTLVDEGTFHPLNSLYNPMHNKNGSTGIVKGLAKIAGRWCVIVASDNKKLAGAWVPGQSENLIRASDTAKMLHIPLVYVLNCSGVKLDEQELVYANRRGGGAPFYRNAELNQLGVPVIVGIFGTNPAGGGYHSISPTILIAHQDANMAVGGAGILGGMNPKGYMDMESAEQLIEATKRDTSTPPGAVPVHYNETGFFREVYADEAGVLAGIRKYVGFLPMYDPQFFRVDDPQEPLYAAEDLYSIVPLNKKRQYKPMEVIARLFDGSQFAEFKKGYGPEIICGLAKVNGLLVGVVTNNQGLLMNYPEYLKGTVGIGGKLYRQGLIKMNEFVTLCKRDRIPLVWIQDTTGIDVGDPAERAELLGLGQSLIYSIMDTNQASLEITLRKGTAAAHYVMGGPQGHTTNVFSLGTAATEMNVMTGETAAAAMYSRRLVKEQKAGNDIQPVIDKMNDLINTYTERSTPEYCAKLGLVDEVVNMTALRSYIKAFTESYYQNPQSITPVHQMMVPRIMRDYDNLSAK